MTQRLLTALPVYNEFRYVDEVLDQVSQYSRDILVVDDGSYDGTSELLALRQDIQVLRHHENQGYGAALNTAFQYACAHDYDVLITIDCDGQHQPRRIPRFYANSDTADIVSGSRYLQPTGQEGQAPAERRCINQQITTEINRRLGLSLTDAFCGFKAYRVSALRQMQLQEMGYAMPLEVWVQAAALNLKIIELPVPLIYLDETRSFGGVLGDGQTRLDYYHRVLDRAIATTQKIPVHQFNDLLCSDRIG